MTTTTKTTNIVSQSHNYLTTRHYLTISHAHWHELHYFIIIILIIIIMYSSINCAAVSYTLHAFDYWQAVTSTKIKTPPVTSWLTTTVETTLATPTETIYPPCSSVVVSSSSASPASSSVAPSSVVSSDVCSASSSVSSAAAAATKKSSGRKRRHILDLISPAQVVP